MTPSSSLANGLPDWLQIGPFLQKKKNSLVDASFDFAPKADSGDKAKVLDSA